MSHDSICKGKWYIIDVLLCTEWENQILLMYYLQLFEARRGGDSVWIKVEINRKKDTNLSKNRNLDEILRRFYWVLAKLSFETHSRYPVCNAISDNDNAEHDTRTMQYRQDAWSVRCFLLLKLSENVINAFCHFHKERHFNYKTGPMYPAIYKRVTNIRNCDFNIKININWKYFLRNYLADQVGPSWQCQAIKWHTKNPVGKSKTLKAQDVMFWTIFFLQIIVFMYGLLLPNKL